MKAKRETKLIENNCYTVIPSEMYFAFRHNWLFNCRLTVYLLRPGKGFCQIWHWKCYFWLRMAGRRQLLIGNRL